MIDMHNGQYLYQIRMIKKWCSRKLLQLVSNIDLEDMKVTKDTFLLMRKAVVNLSNFNGQNYIKCQCQAVWCLCLKKKVKYSYKCHQTSRS